ncbi:unnamed protein product [Cylicostephanus goldi]|uniref:Uncharacterized protein n=1 Tax=Cylicostephanus goldi TaxID=71465 RepID=A0A3P7QAY4_CYLGO|nr:unnamed protein product [Cylicostephanus goldi]
MSYIFGTHGLWLDCARAERYLAAVGREFGGGQALHCTYKFDQSASQVIDENIEDIDQNSAAGESEHHHFFGWHKAVLGCLIVSLLFSSLALCCGLCAPCNGGCAVIFTIFVFLACKSLIRVSNPQKLASRSTFTKMFLLYSVFMATLIRTVPQVKVNTTISLVGRFYQLLLTIHSWHKAVLGCLIVSLLFSSLALCCGLCAPCNGGCAVIFTIFVFLACKSLIRVSNLQKLASRSSFTKMFLLCSVFMAVIGDGIFFFAAHRVDNRFVQGLVGTYEVSTILRLFLIIILGHMSANFVANYFTVPFWSIV